MKPKSEMIRVIRTPEGEIVIDATGKKNGRGAYLCRKKECLDLAVKHRSLERSLKTRISEEVCEKLAEEMESIDG